METTICIAGKLIFDLRTIGGEAGGALRCHFKSLVNSVPKEGGTFSAFGIDFPVEVLLKSNRLIDWDLPDAYIYQMHDKLQAMPAEERISFMRDIYGDIGYDEVKVDVPEGSYIVESGDESSAYSGIADVVRGVTEIIWRKGSLEKAFHKKYNEENGSINVGENSYGAAELFKSLRVKEYDSRLYRFIFDTVLEKLAAAKDGDVIEVENVFTQFLKHTEDTEQENAE